MKNYVCLFAIMDSDCLLNSKEVYSKHFLNMTVVVQAEKHRVKGILRGVELSPFGKLGAILIEKKDFYLIRGRFIKFIGVEKNQ